MTTKISNLTASVFIVALSLGSGISLMPAVFNMLGTVKGFLVMGFIGLITFHSIYSLSYAATFAKEKHDEELTYTTLAGKFSNNLKRCVSISLIVSVMSTAFSFVQRLVGVSVEMLRTNETMDAFFDKNDENMQYYLFRSAFLAVLCTVYYFLFLLDNLSSLAIFSKFSMLAAGVFSSVVSYYGIVAPVDQSELNADHMDFGGALGNAVFALHCQFSFLSVFNSLKDNSLSNTLLVTILGSAMGTVLYSAVGFFGYKGLGSNIGNRSVLGIFSLKYPDIEDSSDLSPELKVLVSLKERYGELLGSKLPRMICFAFIPIFFVGVVSSMFTTIPIMQDMLSRRGKKPSRRSMSIFCCVLTFLFGIFKVNSLDRVLSVFGYLLTTPVSFLFPSLFVLYTSKKKMSIMTISSGIMIALSFTLMIGLLIAELKVSK